MPIKYPTLEDYPAFYEQTKLMHLVEKYKPDQIKMQELLNEQP